MSKAYTYKQVVDTDRLNLVANTKLDKAPHNNVPLLDNNNKIDTAYIPDSLLGQLEFCNIWNATLTTSSLIRPVRKGDYYICSVAGGHNPDGTTASGFDGYEVGDWAVYNAMKAGWDKVDNTDAVTLVNGQKGNVETYKGNYATNTQYYKGDMVFYDSIVWICSVAHTSSSNVPDITKFVPSFLRQASQSVAGMMSASDKQKLDTMNVTVTSSTTATVDDWDVPSLTSTQVTQLYNALVAGYACTVTDSTGKIQFRVIMGDATTGRPSVLLQYYWLGTVDYQVNASSQVVITTHKPKYQITDLSIDGDNINMTVTEV